MLYALKYATHPNNHINGLINTLANDNNVPSRLIQVNCMKIYSSIFLP